MHGSLLPGRGTPSDVDSRCCINYAVGGQLTRDGSTICVSGLVNPLRCKTFCVSKLKQSRAAILRLGSNVTTLVPWLHEAFVCGVVCKAVLTACWKSCGSGDAVSQGAIHVFKWRAWAKPEIMRRILEMPCWSPCLKTAALTEMFRHCPRSVRAWNIVLR
jgi:hypothetical protein